MRLVSRSLASAALGFALAISGCGLVGTHIDCDQVAQQQRAGTSDAEIAQQSGFTVADVQSCSQAAAAGGRERESNYAEQPRLPVIPNIPSGSITSGSISGVGGFH
jgi:uncharacterized protein YceK